MYMDIYKKKLAYIAIVPLTATWRGVKALANKQILKTLPSFFLCDENPICKFFIGIFAVLFGLGKKRPYALL